MNYKKFLFPAFVLLALAQLFVPANMIMEQEDVLRTGHAYKFKTAPFDPYDPFRGKFIYLAFEANTFEVPDESVWDYQEPVFVSLTTDEQGFAKIKNVYKEKPDSESDFVMAESMGKDYNTSNLIVEYEFDRFYMEESKAFEAEQAYRESSIDSSMVAYALVKVKNGHAVLENVFINDVPIKEVVEKGRE